MTANHALSTPPSDRIWPVDRSNAPAMITNVVPSATSISGALASRMFMKLRIEKKLSAVNDMATNSPTTITTTE